MDKKLKLETSDLKPYCWKIYQSLKEEYSVENTRNQWERINEKNYGNDKQ